MVKKAIFQVLRYQGSLLFQFSQDLLFLGNVHVFQDLRQSRFAVELYLPYRTSQPADLFP